MKGRHIIALQKLRYKLPVRIWVSKFEQFDNCGCFNSDMIHYKWPRVEYSAAGRYVLDTRADLANFCREHFGEENFVFMLSAYYFTTEEQAITFKLCNSELL